MEAAAGFIIQPPLTDPLPSCVVQRYAAVLVCVDRRLRDGRLGALDRGVGLEVTVRLTFRVRLTGARFSFRP